MSPERRWWLRTLAVFLNPRPVFVALREDDRDDLDARAEPVLALVWLAGIAGVLATGPAGRVLDDYELDALALAVWAFLAGGIYGFAGYFVGGGSLYLGARGLGSLGTYRRARQVLAFAAAPVALSLVLWPLRLVLFGGDAFRSGGDDAGAAGTGIAVLQLAFILWAVALLIAGVRAVHGWSWWRALGALGVTALTLAAFAALPTVL